jgi:hypothetical protein
MLPYRLRAPVYGNLVERRLKEATGDDALAGGGPVQRAIVEDLVALRTTYQDFLQQQRNEDAAEQAITAAITRNGRHWDQGKVFGSFKKQVFEASRVSHLHSLVPPKCDREAYSQLIYASCLSLLRRAFIPTNPTAVFEEASYALFMLYTLFQINPLPRTYEKSAMELLPMGLQSAENPKFVYRRSFALNIRIDRSHYALLLRLRLMAAEQQSRCQVSCMDAHKQRLLQEATTRTSSEASSSSSSPFWNWTCTCGLSQDVHEIVNRILPLLDLCESTGPVSLEGLVGHEDYPYAVTSSPQESSQQKAPPQVQPEDLQPPLNASQHAYLTDELDRMLARYQSSLKAIRLPPPPPSNHGTLRRKNPPAPSPMSEVLNALLSFESQQAWSDIRGRLFHPLQENATRTLAVEGHGIQEAIASRRDADSGQAVLVAGQAANSETPLAEVEAEPGTDYDLVLPDNLASSARESLQEILKMLAKRQAILPKVLHETDRLRQASTPTEDDDVSSVGEGGISVATGQGREALQALIASARDTRGRIPRVATIPKRPTSIRPPGGGFLDVDMQLLESEDRGDDSHGSASDLSLPDSGDNFSVATEGVGRRALETLLSAVASDSDSTSSNAEAARSEKVSGKRRRNKALPKVRIEEGSIATSIGQGMASLDALLSKHRVESTRNKTPEQRPANSRKAPKVSTTAAAKRKRQMEGATDDAEQSLATSVEQGRAALDGLLSKARARKMPPPSTRGKANKKKGARVGALSLERDESVATSVEQGRAALDALLSRVKGANESIGPIRARSKQASTAVSRTGPTDSVSTSVGQGRAALDALLSKADRDTGSIASRQDEANDIAMFGRLAFDDESETVGTYAEHGRATLDTLLSRLNDGKTPPASSSRLPESGRENIARTKSVNEGESLASSLGPGKSSLDALLSQVHDEGEHFPSPARTSRPKRKNADKDEKDTHPPTIRRSKRSCSEVANVETFEESESVGTSVGPGTAALDALLSRVNSEQRIGRGKPKKKDY